MCIGVYIDITALSLFLSTKKGTLENYFTLTTLSVTDRHTLNKEANVYAKMTKQRHSMECTINDSDGTIEAEVEKSYLVEVIGDTKVSVRVDPASIDDEHFHWYNQNES